MPNRALLPKDLTAASCEPTPNLTTTTDMYLCPTCLTLLESVRAAHPKS